MLLTRQKQQQDCCRKYCEVQNEVDYYVMQRPLHRPRMNLLCAAIIFFGDVGLVLIISCILGNILSIQRYIWMIFVLIFIHTLRLLGLVAVKCYQHHASEERRRRCLCKPTCSEYAISCLKKYVFIYAAIKIYKRLFVTCKGVDYKIDWP